jgi:signal transduction histidine kinase
MNKTGVAIAIIFIIVTVVFLLVLIIIKLYIQKAKKHQQEIYQKNINFQKTINTTILETQEQLLKSVSDDLHDDAGQQLTVINFQLENLKLDFPDNNLNSVSESVTKLSQTIRQISHSLNSNWLDKNGLLVAIESELNRIKKNKNIQISYHIEDSDNYFFTNEEQIVVYRIFQEIINNILKHAKASKIEVTMKCNPKFELILLDNGVGFDYQSAISNSQSIGIQNIQQRAQIINYSIQFLSDLNKGTKVIVSQN